MSTSGSTNFNITVAEMIDMAMFNLGLNGEGDTVSDSDYEKGRMMLNLIVKHLQTMGLNLWTRTDGILFLQADTQDYNIYSSGTNATQSYAATTTSASASSSATAVVVTSTTGITASNYIGIELSTGALQWTTVSSVVGSTVNLGAALSASVASGARVYSYTTKLAKPVDILPESTRIYCSSDYSEIKCNYISLQEFDEIPNKTDTTSQPTSYTINKQRDYIQLRFWPLPDDVDYLVKFAFSREIEDLDSTVDNLDIPKEWLLPMVDMLTVRLAPGFNKEEKASKLMVPLAQSSMENASAFDTEKADIQIQPDFGRY